MPNSVKKLRTSAAVKRYGGTQALRGSSAASRAKLVGKFPEVQHFSAPKAKRKLDDETRRKIVALMELT